ncbi:MAG TPA: TPM domain-containing protein [Gemmatimonadaceae bacterium]
MYLGLALLVSFVLAQDPSQIAKYVPQSPDRDHLFVLDSAHILSAATIAALNDSCRALQAETAADVVWVTLPTLGGRPIEEAALYIGRTWRIGSAGKPGDPLRNRGLVTLYIPDRTKTAGPNFRVEVGNGLEGTITDSRSRSISAAMREDLRAKRYDAAYLAGWGVAAKLVREDFAASRAVGLRPTAPIANPARTRESNAEAFFTIALVGVIVILLIVLLIIAAHRSNRRRLQFAGSEPRGRRPSSPVFVLPVSEAPSDDDDIRRGSSNAPTSSSDTFSAGDSFGGGGDFSGGGSSDTI